jgi:hypothetical protein
VSDLTLGLSRRRFLTRAGALAGAAVVGAPLLAACGGDDGDGDGNDRDGGAAATGSSTAKELNLVQFFGGPLFAAGQPLRAPFGIADDQGLLKVADTPKEVEVEIVDATGARVGKRQTIARHASGLERAYFPLEATLPEAGIYAVRADLGGAAPTEFNLEVKDGAELVVIQPGDALPALQTPTTADPRGVNPICTADPVCPLHDRTAAEALGTGQPLALLIATPAFCQVTICGPVLDVLLDARDDFPDVTLLHAEVYADPTTSLQQYAPTVQELGLHLEPVLVTVGADGKVVDRIDSIYDATELRTVLQRLS